MMGDAFGAIVLACLSVAAVLGVWWLLTVVRIDMAARKKKAGLLALCCLYALSGCTRVEPGNVGIKVENLGPDKGVQDYVVTTGLAGYIPIITSVYEYPTYTQTVRYDRKEALNFNSKEGTVFMAAMSVSCSLQASKVPSFYVKFRHDNLTAFTHGFFKNVVRSSLNSVAEKYTAEEVYSLKKEEIVSEALGRINAEVGEYGVVVEQFGFLSAPEPADQIISAITAKTGAIQNAIRVENELRQAQAEAQKMIASAKGEAESLVTRARGEAEANLKVAQSLTPLLVQKIAIDKWNGQQPQCIGGGAVPMVQMPFSK